jgi:GT2 family glycosyltransferase
MTARPELSVVIGAQNARSSISDCLTALENQRCGRAVEILVVDNSTDGTAEMVSRRFPHLRLIRSPAARYMPELWERGINHSTGELVAITTADFVPRNDWIENLLKAHQSSYAGIGGAIENDHAAGLVGWAIYFCRYSRYMLPFSAATVGDFAGDNAAYKRPALDRCREVRRRGFWEPFVHAELLKAGFQLLLSPEIVVYHHTSFGAPDFIRQRFWHGRQFGSDRARSLPGWKRAVYLLLSPVIPLLLFGRIARRVSEKGRHRGKFILSAPMTLVFLLGWAAGEASGYLWPQRSGQFEF